MQLNLTINIDGRIFKKFSKIFTRKNVIIFIAVIAVGVGGFVVAEGTFTKPYTFNTGDTIFADELNENFDRLYDEVLKLQGNNSGFESGMIMIWPKVSPPTGWFLCDGSIVDGAKYPKLSAALYGSQVTNCKLPDLRGRVVIGYTNMTNTNCTPPALEDTRKIPFASYLYNPSDATANKGFGGQMSYPITNDFMLNHSHVFYDLYGKITESTEAKNIVVTTGTNKYETSSDGSSVTSSGNNNIYKYTYVPQGTETAKETEAGPRKTGESNTTIGYDENTKSYSVIMPAVSYAYIIKHD